MRKRLTIFGTLTLLLLIGFLLIKAKEGGNPNEIYPQVNKAPTLKLTWSGQLNPKNTIRYTPYGIWEGVTKHKDGNAYEPANEMQFYIKTNTRDFLAVAPGIITRNEVFENSVGLISVRYGENYVVTYLHIIPRKNLKAGTKVETGDALGEMEKRNNPYHGEETWWEIQLTTKKDGFYRTLPPYDYFDEESKYLLDEIAENSKEVGPGENDKKPYWTVSEGCSWIKYTGTPEWWDSNRFGGFYQKESEKEFIKNINPNWKVSDKQGRIVGPTDICN